MKPLFTFIVILVVSCSDVLAGQTNSSPSSISHLPSPRDWLAALSRIPLDASVTELNRTNCIPVILNAFQSNDVVKAVIFMPGATDELYFFRRAHATLPADPSLADAIVALTNQTYI